MTVLRIGLEKNKNRRGVLLAEVLVTAFLVMAITFFSFLAILKQLARARDARRKADLDRLKIAMEEYYFTFLRYPRELPDCGQPLLVNNSKILAAIPCDPKTGQPYYYESKRGNGQYFRIYALLEDGRDNSIDFARCRGGCGGDCQYNYGVSSANVALISCSYVCAPGGGKTGSCELYNDPEISLCPKLYYRDATCQGECSNPANRCQNASGKNIPY